MLRKIDYKMLLLDFLNCRGDLQEYLNRRFISKDLTVIRNSYYSYLVTKEDCKFYMTPDINTIEDVLTDYNYSDIKNNDIVVDIGANIGGFSIPASKKGIVHAIEPVRILELNRNILLNNASISTYQVALSDQPTVTIKWMEKPEVTVTGKSFKEIVKMVGGVDFLKVDCEGPEYLIDPDDLSDVRRIEMEMHKFGHSGYQKAFDNFISKISKTHDISLTVGHNDNIFGILHGVLK